jgi:hypothetical protein
MKLAKTTQDLVPFGGHKSSKDRSMVAAMGEGGCEVHVGEKAAKSIQAHQSMKVKVSLCNILV